MHKKILGLLLIFSLISPSLALNPNFSGQFYKNIKLEETNQKKIDLIIEKFLEKIKTSKKTQEILNKLNKIDDEKYNKNIQYFLGKLKEKLKFKLENLKYKEIAEKARIFQEEQIKKAKEAQEKYLKKQKEAQEKVNKKINSQISKKNKISGENKILNLQKILAGNINNNISNFEKKFKKYLYVQEKGNLKVNLNIDINEINVKTNLNLKDYFSNTQFLDNELKTNLELLINSKFKNKIEKNFNLKISSFLHFIQKDGNIFLLIKNPQIDGKNLSQDIKINLDNFTNNLNIFNGKFIKFPNNSIQKKVLNNIKNLKIDYIKKEISKKLEKPLLTPYKKVGNKYYLIPTQYTCDLFLDFSKIIPYYGEKINCSENDYKEMLANFEDANFDIILENNKLEIIGNNKKLEKNSGYITFDKHGIKEIKYEIIPSQKKFPGEKFSFKYKKNQFFNIYFNYKKGNILYNIKTNLNYKNQIKKLKYILKFNNYYSKTNLILKYKNNNFSGKIDVKDKNDKEIFNLNFSGEILKDYFKLNSNFETENIYIRQEIKDEKIKGKLNIETDLRNNKDNANIFFNISKGKKEIFNFKLENKGKVEFKKQEIKAPKDYIDFNKVMQNSY